jgi:hypothetical protein
MRLTAGAIVLLWGLGCAAGLLAAIGAVSSLRPDAQLCFDLGVLLMMVTPRARVTSDMSTRV